MVEVSTFLSITANSKLCFVNRIPSFQDAMEIFKGRLVYEFHGEHSGWLYHQGGFNNPLSTGCELVR